MLLPVVCFPVQYGGYIVSMTSNDFSRNDEIVLWIGFRHTGPISLCIDLFVFICVYLVCFCFILHSCSITPSVLRHCWFGHMACKNRP